MLVPASCLIESLCSSLRILSAKPSMFLLECFIGFTIDAQDNLESALEESDMFALSLDQLRGNSHSQAIHQLPVPGAARVQ